VQDAATRVIDREPGVDHAERQILGAPQRAFSTHFRSPLPRTAADTLDGMPTRARAALYHRVSTLDQNPHAARRELRACRAQ
jgi:hypothetical protein